MFWGHIFWRKNKIKNREQGFTLIEMLVVITIIAVVGVGVVSAFMSGMKLWSRAGSTDFAVADAMLSMELVARDLRQAVLIKKIASTGDAYQVSFAAVPDNNVLKITYIFDKDKKALMRQIETLTDVLDDKLSKSEEEYIAGFDDFSMSYLYYNKTKGRYEWDSRFDREEEIFSALKMKAKAGSEEIEKTVFIPVS